jgi:hypothetical protein
MTKPPLSPLLLAAREGGGRRFALVIADAGLTLPRRGQVLAFARDRRTLH